MPRYLSQSLAAIVTALILAATARAGGVETWREEGAGDFRKGKAERVVVSDSGRVRLGRVLTPAGAIEAEQVWALARTNGEAPAVYAATGSRGRVYRRADGAAEAQAWEVVFDSDAALVLSLAVAPDGHVFAGTGPTGEVVDLTDPGHPAARPGESVRYVWGLAAGKDGTLWAATGPEGKLWRRPAGGVWTVALDSEQDHLLCVAIGPDGSAYAGSGGEGLVYRVAPDGKVSVLYDAPQAEVRCLAIGPDGALYAGTADDASGRGTRTPSRSADANAPSPAIRRATFVQKDDTPGRAEGGTAAPKPVSPGENAVYRIDPEGDVREVFRAKVLVHALAAEGDRLLVGTGPEGQLYEIRDGGREIAPLARLDHGEVLSLLAPAAAEGDVLVGAGNPGAVLALSDGFASEGMITSNIFDAKYVAKAGAVTWRADVPDGTGLAVQVRSGNVGEPDVTWSDWSAPQTNPRTAVAAAPPGRFWQYRATLTTTVPALSPELRSVAIRYRTRNLPPELGEIKVPDLAEGDGATNSGKLAIKWDAKDPNGDGLSFVLHVQKEGWPGWVRLDAGPALTEPSYSWDTTALPSGVYRLRVTANDRAANPPSEALERIRESESFIVDHDAPRVSISVDGKTAKVVLADALTRITRAESSLDGGAWTPVFPADGLFDRLEETLTIALPADLEPGVHVLTVRSADAAGNIGSGDAVFRVGP